MITWNIPIWLYLWLAGMAGGAYFAAFLAERYAGEVNRQLLRLAIYLGIPAAGIGVILLVIDLGHPLRFWHLLASFKGMSPMSMGTWILLVWSAVSVAMVILWLAERRIAEAARPNLRRWTEVLAWINFVFAVLLMAYTGVLLAVSSKPLWAGTILLPPLFVASAISTGVAIVLISAAVVPALGIPGRTVGQLAEADAIVILIELGALIGFAFSLSGSAMAGAGEALRLLTTGALAAPFWIGIVLLALLIPLGLELANWGKDIETKTVWRAIVASSACVVLGGLILRAVIVIGGQM